LGNLADGAAGRDAAVFALMAHELGAHVRAAWRLCDVRVPGSRAHSGRGFPGAPNPPPWL